MTERYFLILIWYIVHICSCYIMRLYAHVSYIGLTQILWKFQKIFWFPMILKLTNDGGGGGVSSNWPKLTKTYPFFSYRTHALSFQNMHNSLCINQQVIFEITCEPILLIFSLNMSFWAYDFPINKITKI